MLAYLALCARRGVCVVEYEDHPRGTLIVDPERGGWFESVTLSPVVTIADGSDEDLAARLHDTAHARCFIAKLVQQAGAARGDNPDRRHRESAVKDLAILLPDRPGALAEMGEALGCAGSTHVRV